MGSVSPGEPPPGGEKSPLNKKRRLIPYSMFDQTSFPGLVQKPGSAEMYLHIKSEVQGKKMLNLNRFKLEHFLTKITKKWTKASFNRDGDLILKVGDEETAKLLMGTKSIGDYKVNITRHETLNCSKGVIFCPDLIDMPEEDIKEGMSLFHKVKEIFVPKRIPRQHNDSQRIPTAKAFGLIIITFDQLEPPKQVNVGFKKVEVRPYIPNPRRCRTCQMLGHTTRFCPTKQEICGTCGQIKIENHTCNGIYCVNCSSDDHTSTDSKCPKWLMSKELEAIMVLQKLSKFEAKKLFYSLYGDEKEYAKTKNMTLAERLRASAVEKNTMTPTNEKTNTAKTATSPKVTIPVKTAATSARNTSTTSATTSANNKSNQSNDTNKQDDGKSNVNLRTNKESNSRLKLVKWEVREDEVSYFLRNLTSSGAEPVLDLKKFKKPNEATQEKINELVRIFNECQSEIKSVLGENPKCDYIHLFIKDGITVPWPKFGKLEDRQGENKEVISGDSVPEISSDEEMSI